MAVIRVIMGGKAPFLNELLASYFIITCVCIPIHYVLISISTFTYISHKPLYIIGYVLFVILIMVLLNLLIIMHLLPMTNLVMGTGIGKRKMK